MKTLYCYILHIFKGCPTYSLKQEFDDGTIYSIMPDTQLFYEPALSTFSSPVQVLSFILCSVWCSLWSCSTTMVFDSLISFYRWHSKHNCLFQRVWLYDNKYGGILWFCLSLVRLVLYAPIFSCHLCCLRCRSLSNTTAWMNQFFYCSCFHGPTFTSWYYER